MWKKSFLSCIIIFILVGCFALPCFAIDMTESFNVDWASSVLFHTPDITSVSSVGNGYSQFSINQDTNTLFALFDTSSLDLVGGESYKFTTTVKTSSYMLGFSPIIRFALIDRSVGSSGTLPDKVEYFCEVPITQTSTNIVTQFNCPSDFAGYYILCIWSNGSSNRISNSYFQLYRGQFFHIKKSVDVDQGDWTGSSDTLETFPDMSVLDGDFQDNFGDAYDFLHNNYYSVSNSIRNTAYFFGFIWDALTQVVPEYVYLIVFSLMGGAFCFVVFRRRS